MTRRASTRRARFENAASPHRGIGAEHRECHDFVTPERVAAYRLGHVLLIERCSPACCFGRASEGGIACSMLVDILPGLLRQIGVAPAWVEPASNGLSLIVLLGGAKLAHHVAKRHVVDVVSAFVRRSAAS